MHHDDYNATCVKCGTKAQKRPHPYARYWFTEWHLPDGSYTTNYNGEPTPPCPPIEPGAEQQLREENGANDKDTIEVSQVGQLVGAAVDELDKSPTGGERSDHA
jgi:hypothetical protein